ncbi:hypothetical protein KXW38_009066 [Aspergillus fumigatus]|nr:hypothetical protein KXW38_009066 [Aspergillus fumigatus]
MRPGWIDLGWSAACGSNERPRARGGSNGLAKAQALVPAAWMARGCAVRLPSPGREGAGKAGRRRHPQDIPAFPAQWVYGLYVISPTPGSRRQDHTTSPSAAYSVSPGEGSPSPAAAIASRAQRYVTIAHTPLRRGTG